MRSPACVICLLFVAVAAAQADPTGAVAAAAKDLATQPEALRTKIRYLSTYGLPGKARPDFSKALTFWTNALSTEAEIVPLTMAGPDLYRLNIEDYGEHWLEPWEKFAKVDPYFHERVFVTRRGKEVVRTITARWLPADQMAYLVNETQSAAPILRADWFLVQTSQQEGRNGTGYYNFLGLNSRRDFERLVGLDSKASIRLKREIKAIIGHSTVAINNRQIVRFQSITGGYWTTLDVINSVGNKNAVRNLDKDYKHDFEEHFGVLPNGLFAYYLSAANGNQANTAPDNVASDGESISPDRRVHSAASCVRCHREGLRPIDDLSRRIYTPPLALQSPSYKKFKRLRQLYIADLKRWLVRDQGDYAQALALTNGLTPEANAKTFATAWEAYNDKPLAGEDVARELGCTLAELQAKLKQAATATGDVDPVVAQLFHNPPLQVRRDHVEESYGILQALMRGYEP